MSSSIESSESNKFIEEVPQNIDYASSDMSIYQDERLKILIVNDEPFQLLL